MNEEPAFEYVSVQQIVDRVSHIYGLYRDDAAATKSQGPAEHHARLSFLRGVIDNLKHQNSRLSPRTLRRFSHYAALTIGGSFRLTGYYLDRMRDTEFILNGHRTRIIESYPFYRDRLIDLPHMLSEENVWRSSALISDVVLSWQEGLPIRTLQNPNWQDNGIFYIQIGAEESLALSGLPPGAILSIEPISAEEQANPDPNAVYCLQFGNGYLCCSCAVSHGRLALLPRDGRYAGLYDFFYPQQVRIAGRARGFAVWLPPSLNDRHESRPGRVAAPLVLPWEHASLNALLRTERLRFGRTARDLAYVNEILQARIGASLSERTLHRYERQAERIPQTDTMLALSLFCAVRISDVLRLLGFAFNESNSYSLSTWLQAGSFEQLREQLRSAMTPDPLARWRLIRADWGDWPSLLSMTIPRMAQLKHRLLRVHQRELFDGLDPLVQPGAIGLLEELDNMPDLRGDREKQGWERPIYVIRHKGNMLCGHLDQDEQHVVLIPHPRSHARRIALLRHQVEIVGQIKGIGSPFRAIR